MGVNVAVLDYGIGNLRSAQKSLIRAGADAVLTADPALIAEADGVVLPGVGAFGACMQALERTGLDVEAKKAAASGRPFLGICVGMQLLYEGSDETPGRPGLGILNGNVALLPEGVKRPQMQWNKLHLDQPDHVLLDGLDDAWMYFVHSYVAPMDEHTIASVDYGGPMCAAVGRDQVWATQFHPEKSADAGRQMLTNWVRHVEQTVSVGAPTGK